LKTAERMLRGFESLPLRQILYLQDIGLMNLLANSGVRRAFKSRWFPLGVQLLLLAVFGGLIIWGWGVTTSDPDFAKVLRNTNLANLIVWSFWWPLMVIVAVLFGRLWCLVCPLELVTSAASQIGLKRRFPRSLKRGWLITVLYILILFLGVQTLSIHRLPHRMVVYLLVLFGLAVLVGFVFERRPFCAYICPVGHLLGLYAHLSPLEWRVTDGEICRTCKGKDCVAKGNRYRWYGRACPNELVPFRLTHNGDCILCTQCLKACPYDNFRWSLRPFFRDLFARESLLPSQVAFLLVVSGFVIYELGSEWKPAKHLLLTVPHAASRLLGIEGTPGAGTVKAVLLFLFFPLLLWLIPALLHQVLNPQATRKDYFFRAALFYLPLIASAHVIKGMHKIVTRLGYLPGAIAEPTGLSQAQAIFAGTMPAPTAPAIRLDPLIDLASTLLLAISIGVAVALLRRHWPWPPQANQTEGEETSKGWKGIVAPALALFLYAGLLVSIVLPWRWSG
ncbi:MAG TPA: 4Fe-4S binding protein, partial [Armatimonadetes bacterium]|nr:4Fe-4S binding protein [Armatimonadota bacterium]